MVKAVKTVEGFDVEAKALEALEGVVDTSERANASTLTPPKPWLFNERRQTLVLPDGFQV